MQPTCVEPLDVDPDCQSVFTGGKSNHSSANCRYRPIDNREEPRQTPDALRTGATSKNLASVSRNQTGPALHTNTNNPFSHIRWKRTKQPTLWRSTEVSPYRN